MKSQTACSTFSNRSNAKRSVRRNSPVEFTANRRISSNFVPLGRHWTQRRPAPIRQSKSLRSPPRRSHCAVERRGCRRSGRSTSGHAADRARLPPQAAQTIHHGCWSHGRPSQPQVCPRVLTLMPEVSMPMPIRKLSPSASSVLFLGLSAVGPTVEVSQTVCPPNFHASVRLKENYVNMQK
jgi:hypothetical protein